jgi:metal-dependent hydrolase (beta-lactamase superfamily II)
MTARQVIKAVIKPEIQEKFAQLVQPDPFVEDVEEPQILFLGTSSMKPGLYRGASAIYYINEKRGVLMDCAEGSYGQILDHFGDKTPDVLLKTKVIFITHIHGDHQLGIMKVLQERDNLMDNLKNREFGKIYAVIPTLMHHYIESYIEETIKHKDMIVLVNSKDLNPEKLYYYQKFNHYRGFEEEDRPPLECPICEPLTSEEVDKRMKEYIPGSEEAKEMLDVLKTECGIDRLLAIEVDHCP